MTHDEYKNLLISISLERLDVFLGDLDLGYTDHCIKKRADKGARIAVHIAKKLLDEIDDALDKKERASNQSLYTEKVRDKMNYLLDNC